MPTQPAIADALEDRPRSRVGDRVDPLLADFVVAHYDRLVRLAYLVCGHGADAADAVQRGLELAWRGRSSLRDEARLRPWLDRVVVREAIRLGRRPWFRRVLSLDTRVGWIEPAAATAPETHDWLALRTAFDRLPHDQRAVIALHLHAGYSVAETAEIVDAPIETVRTRLRRAKDRLRDELGEPAR